MILLPRQAAGVSLPPCGASCFNPLAPSSPLTVNLTAPELPYPTARNPSGRGPPVAQSSSSTV